MNFTGIIVGLGAFLIIGLLHPVVIKAEYHFGKRCWPAFALGGVICCIASIMMQSLIASILCGVFAFSLFCGIHELIEQEERVKKGWFPSKNKE